MREENIFDKAKTVIKHASAGCLGEPDDEKMEEFINVCEIIDQVMDDGGCLRTTISVDAEFKMIEFVLDLMEFGAQPPFIAPIKLIDKVNYIYFDGIPAGDLEGEIPEAVRVTFGVDGVWK